MTCDWLLKGTEVTWNSDLASQECFDLFPVSPVNSGHMDKLTV